MTVTRERTIAEPTIAERTPALLTCTADWHGTKVRFELRNDGSSFRWYFPDGSKTSLCRDCERGANRAMMYNAARLAREYSSLVRPAREADIRRN